MRRTVALAAVAAVLGALAAAVRLARLEPMLVQGESMRPTLVPGHRIAVGPVDRPPARGDLVVLRHPLHDGLEVVKRVVGLPGERVVLDAGRLEVDGRALAEPYLHRAWPPDPAAFEVRLGPEQYLVLGDHRVASTDGREFGPTPADAFLGRVRLAYWPPRRLRPRAGDPA
jgi:signal peptidase I